MGKGGRTKTTWEPAWNSGKTTAIRVPVKLKNDILAYARGVDAELINNTQNIPSLSGDFLQQAILEAIDRYIEYKRHNYHPNQNSRKLDTSTRAWDEMRKFNRMVETSFDRLGSTSAG